MRHNLDIVLILDSVLDDYYFLWECFSEYSQIRNLNSGSIHAFSNAVQSAYKYGYLDFFKGTDFDGEEEIVTDLILSDQIIESMLNHKNHLVETLRVTTSNIGVDYLRSFHDEQNKHSKLE